MKRATYVCDLCGKESATKLPVATLHDGGTMIARRDVCVACAEAGFLNSGQMSIWNRAKWANETYRPVRTVKPVVGITTEEVVSRGIDVNWSCCRSCGHHVCSCEFIQPLQGGPAVDFSTGLYRELDKMFGGVATNPCQGTALHCSHEKHLLCRGCVRLFMSDGDQAFACRAPSCPHYGMNAPTPGTFAWLKTLAPETKVRRAHWAAGDERTVAGVFADCGYLGILAWVEATDWQLFEEKPRETHITVNLPSFAPSIEDCNRIADQLKKEMGLDAASSFSPGDRVRLKVNGKYGTVRSRDGAMFLIDVYDDELPFIGVAFDLEHARKPEPAKGETLHDRAVRMIPAEVRKDVSCSVMGSGEDVRLVVSCPGHCPAVGCAFAGSADEEIARLWAKLITWCSGHRVAEIAKTETPYERAARMRTDDPTVPRCEDCAEPQTWGTQLRDGRCEACSKPPPDPKEVNAAINAIMEAARREWAKEMYGADSPAGLSAQERETVKKLVGATEKSVAHWYNLAVTDQPTKGVTFETLNEAMAVITSATPTRVPLDDEALVLLCLKTKHLVSGNPADYRMASAAFHDACPDDSVNRICTLVDNDDARLVEMCLAARKDTMWGPAKERFDDAMEARKAIGDTDVWVRIRRLADAK